MNSLSDRIEAEIIKRSLLLVVSSLWLFQTMKVVCYRLWSSLKGLGFMLKTTFSMKPLRLLTIIVALIVRLVNLISYLNDAPSGDKSKFRVETCFFGFKMNENYELKFSGIGRLYGLNGMERLEKSHICVVGVGGVGSWCVEALARKWSWRDY